MNILNLKIKKEWLYVIIVASLLFLIGALHLLGFLQKCEGEKLLDKLKTINETQISFVSIQKHLPVEQENENNRKRAFPFLSFIKEYPRPPEFKIEKKDEIKQFLFGLQRAIKSNKTGRFSRNDYDVNIILNNGEIFKFLFRVKEQPDTNVYIHIIKTNGLLERHLETVVSDKLYKWMY